MNYLQTYMVWLLSEDTNERNYRSFNSTSTNFVDLAVWLGNYEKEQMKGFNYILTMICGNLTIIVLPFQLDELDTFFLSDMCENVFQLDGSRLQWVCRF